MPLDPQFKEIVELYAELPALAEMPLDALRGAPEPNPDATQLDAVTERSIPGPGGELAVRIYRCGSGEGLPLLLFMHGGGFVLGNLDTHDDLARDLTRGTGCVTVSVAYRLAPEHPYPAATDDCMAALRWAAANATNLGADPARLAVIGDSAGGNLAAVTAMRARDEGGPPVAAQVLVYPTADLTAPMLPAPDGNFYILSPDTRRFFNESYLADPAQATLPYVSPGLADNLSNLPPTFMVTAEYDPLCAQGEALAERYRQAGVEVAHTRYDGAIHGFATFPVPMREQALAEITAWLRAKLH
jgi:acetyl esterase